MTQQDQTLATFKAIGKKLKKHRNKKRYSVAKTAKLLKLPDSTIKQLEDPSDDSLKSVYKSNLYIKYASLFDLEDSVEKQLSTIKEPLKTTPKKPKGTKKVLVLSSSIKKVSFLIVVLILSSYIVYQASILFLSPRLSLNTDDRTIVTEREFVLKGSVARSSIVLINNQPILLDKNGYFEHKIYLQEGINLINVSAANNLSRETSKTLQIILEND